MELSDILTILTDSLVRVPLSVEVSYQADLDQVVSVAREVLTANSRVLKASA